MVRAHVVVPARIPLNGAAVVGLVELGKTAAALKEKRKLGTMKISERSLEETLPTTDINLLHKVGELDTRTYNLCKTNGFKNLDDLTEYYLEHGTFKQLRNCGVISNHLLIKLCKRHATNPQNVLYLEEDALKFERFEMARKALENGYIDALVLLGRNSSVVEHDRTIKGKLGICRTSNLD